jgi:hypothetical protein
MAEAGTRGIKFSNVSVDMADDSKEESRNAMREHLLSKEGLSMSFLLVGEKVKEGATMDDITFLNIYNLLVRVATNRINVLAVGCDEGSVIEYLEGLRRILSGIMRYMVIKAEDINKKMREFITAFKEVSKSL